MKNLNRIDGVELLSDRVSTYGEENASDLELLTLLLGDAKLALDLIGKYESMARLVEAPRAELGLMRFVRPSQLTKLKVAAEIGKRAIAKVSAVPPKYLRSTADTIAFFKPLLEKLETEVLYLVLLDTRKRVIKIEEIARGGINTLSVFPREVLCPAIRALAHSMILVHSHPSGSAEPSQADRDLTTRTRALGQMVGVELIDHCIIGRGGGSSVI